jgi:hypothetical protein
LRLHNLATDAVELGRSKERVELDPITDGQATFVFLVLALHLRAAPEGFRGKTTNCKRECTTNLGTACPELLKNSLLLLSTPTFSSSG